MRRVGAKVTSVREDERPDRFIRGGVPVTSSIIAAISRPSSCTRRNTDSPVCELEVRSHGVFVGWMRNHYERLHLDSQELDDGVKSGL